MIATVNPATGLTEMIVEPHSGKEVNQRITEAAAAFEVVSAVSFEQRALWMNAAAALLEAEAESLGQLITVEMGKPISQSIAEVRKCATVMRFYAEKAEKFLASESLSDPTTVGASHARSQYQPLGVVLAVMPWNYPFWQVIRFAAPALMAGNTALLKHASNVPQAAMFLDTLFERGGFPSGSLRTLLIGSNEVEAVISDRRVKAVTLTGSEPAGRSVGALAGKHIKKVVLELGGSDPFIVLPRANLGAAVETALRARVSNNGQSCIAAKRFIIHEEVYEQFVGEFSRAMASLTVGDPLDSETQVGPLATESGRRELCELVDDARAKGATILTGGTALDRPGWFFAPAVIADLPDSARLVQEEAFGPVASVYRVKSNEEALRVANQTSFGLSSSVWTNDDAEQEWFTSHLDAGAVFINGMTVSYPELPFGGIKDSGIGRELAAVGIREFCNLKTVWKA